MSMVGVTHHRLTVVQVDRRRKLYEVRCACGTVKWIDRRNFRALRSCGCTRGKARITHGFTVGSADGKRRPAEYEVWSNMIRRCTDEKNKQYRDYGGRGIKVCARWRSFTYFYADLGPRPSSKHTVERIDNDKGYEPGNVRWATRLEQNRNKRNNVKLCVDGMVSCLTETAERHAINKGTLHSRLNRGWVVDEAVRTPAVPRHAIALMPGARFGLLVVVRGAEQPASAKQPRRHFLVRCDCGAELVVRGSRLVDSSKKFCGRYCEARRPK